MTTHPHPPARLASRLMAAALAAGLAACAPRAALQDGIRNPEAASRIRVAMAAEDSGQPDVALSMFAAAAAAAPEEPEVQARFAAMLARNNQTQEAEQVLVRALERRPRDPRLLLTLGQMRLRGGDAAAALASFDQALAQSPRDLAALNGRGVALDMLGRHAEAQRSYRTAQAVDPSHIPSANNLAFSLMLDGQPAQAVALLSALNRRPGAPARVGTNLGIAQAAAGDRGAARSTLEGRIDDGDLGRIVAALGGGQRSSAPEAPQRAPAQPAATPPRALQPIAADASPQGFSSAAVSSAVFTPDASEFGDPVQPGRRRPQPVVAAVATDVPATE